MSSSLLKRWARKYFSDPEALILVVLLALGFAVVLFLGNTLTPVFASVVIAYLLEAAVTWLTRRGVPRLLAVFLVFCLFLTFLLFLFFGLVPLLSKQVTQLAQELPKMIAVGQHLLQVLPERYPQFFSIQQAAEMAASIRSGVTSFGQNLLSLSLSSLPHLFTLALYLVLVPVMVFFFLKDKEHLHDVLSRYLPRERGVATRVWVEMDQQIGNYIRGKITEILLVGLVSVVTFAALGLKYAMLLGALVGLSVVVPYIGAIAVTVPVVLIAYYQWGPTREFAYLFGAYMVIQILDGNLVVPWLFSEAVNLHPIAIIVAVLVFGGVWGFWGVFFAIPLATLVMAVIHAWPRATDEGEHPTGGASPA
ncbi:MAG: AI-2E family transporter [Deferrisomatales bacterium]|nr:AI-2E family transporter [Deferrisomatales bacterium]